MGSFQNFLLRMKAGGGSMRDDQIKNATHLVEETFTDDPSYIKDGTTIYQTNRVIHPRIYLQKYRSSSPAQASIQTQLHERFFIGDIIPWPEHGYWLCVESNNLHGVLWEGTLQFCNYNIKFLSPLTGEILVYPVSLINNARGGGETVKEYMKTGASQLIMYISYDQHTVLLDNGFRFLIDRNKELPTAFEIKQADTVSYSDGNGRGYIQLSIEESQFNPKTDDKELMIADYYPDPTGSAEELQDEANDGWI